MLNQRFLYQARSGPRYPISRAVLRHPTPRPMLTKMMHLITSLPNPLRYTRDEESLGLPLLLLLFSYSRSLEQTLLWPLLSKRTHRTLVLLNHDLVSPPTP
jgi:hypothetical protein